MPTAKEYNAAKKMFERKVTEEDVLQEIVIRLRAAKITIFRVRENLPTGYRMSDPGIPDLHGRVPRGYFVENVIINGVLQASPGYFVQAVPVYIEVKKPGEMEKYHAGGYRSKPKRERTFARQMAFIKDAQADGAIACFAESWDNVVDEFKKNGVQLPK